MTLENLEVLSNSDVAKWMRLLPKRVARIEGAAVICIDHVSKTSDAGDRYALGGQHKLAGVSGATYRFTTVKPLTRPRGIEPETGMVDITVTKDRPGWIRRNTLGGKIGTFVIESYPDDTLRAELMAPGEMGPDHELVTAILHYLRDYDGSSKRGIEEGVEGKAARIREALRWMAAEGRWWIRIEPKGNSHHHWLTDEGRAELEKRP